MKLFCNLCNIIEVLVGNKKVTKHEEGRLRLAKLAFFVKTGGKMRQHSKKLQVIVLGVMMLAAALLGGYAYAQRPKDVKLNADGVEISLYTSADTVREALAEAGYKNIEGARISQPLDKQIEDGMEVELNTLKNISFKDGDNEKTIKTYSSTVGQFLDETGAEYDEDDMIAPARMGLLQDGDRVILDHIEKVQESKSVEVAFETETKESDQILQGQTKVEREGKAGQRLVTTESVYKNGIKIQEKEISNEINSEPVNKIVVKGTKKAPKNSGSSTGEISLKSFMSRGVVNWRGYKFTYYSQRVLPGGGLKIPGRHVNSRGYVCDGNGYIVLAGSAARGTVFQTPFGGPGKIYDKGTRGRHLDVYIR